MFSTSRNNTFYDEGIGWTTSYPLYVFHRNISGCVQCKLHACNNIILGFPGYSVGGITYIWSFEMVVNYCSECAIYSMFDVLIWLSVFVGILCMLLMFLSS